MLNILCTGHGSYSIGCGYDFVVADIEVSTAIFGVCPDCGTKTDLEKTYVQSHGKANLTE
jgi:hypothetical protein